SPVAAFRTWTTISGMPVGPGVGVMVGVSVGTTGVSEAAGVLLASGVGVSVGVLVGAVVSVGTTSAAVVGTGVGSLRQATSSPKTARLKRASRMLLNFLAFINQTCSMDG